MSDNLKTYFVLGHGTDLTREYGNILGLDIRRVPEGCIYCTIAQPGDLSYLSLIQGLYNFEHDISKRDKLFDPQGNYLDIKEIVESAKDRGKASFSQIFTVFVDGDTFVNNRSSYMLNFSVSDFLRNFRGNDDIYLCKSGLYEISRDHPIPDPYNLMTERFANSNKITLEDIHFLYDGAIVPNVDILLAKLKTYHPSIYTLDQLKQSVRACISDMGIEDQASLFKKYPGIHYNFGCQTLNEDIDRRRLLDRRQYEVGIVGSFNAAFAERLQRLEERNVDPLQRKNYGVPQELTPQELRNYKEKQQLYSAGILYGGKFKRPFKKSRRSSKKSNKTRRISKKLK